ncbi:hypothetical protein BCF46_0392 [Litoreibacter meonggei]|uniref:DUF2065 domain-containing protein n=1 Tax=Litoreibacter meonggei TaxID=1049199 RepID=A0A497X4Q1_9RHOB|nr:DUF2065 family protein [Litoreibacter meonggei]RLJ60195.1 hypothetical protein BCF46_0392 [Litoreibacter meonggei]
MLTHIALAVGLVLVVEGLVLALAPSRMEDIVKALAEIPPETRRMLGLVTVALGVLCVWISKGAFG